MDLGKGGGFSAAALYQRTPLKNASRVFPDGQSNSVQRRFYTYIWYFLRNAFLRAKNQRFVVNMTHPGQDAGALKQMLNLGFSTKDIDRLYTTFLLCDRDNLGVIELQDFDRFFKLGRYAIYSQKIFAMLDRDGDSAIAFDEFVLALFNYCSFDKDSLVKFAFTLMDTNMNNRIERDELAEYMDNIYSKVGPKRSKRRVDDLMRLFGKSELDIFGIGMPEFLAFHSRVPNLLFPAFHVQNILRHRTLGDRFWKKMSEGRVLSKAREQNIYEILARMRVKKVL